MTDIMEEHWRDATDYGEDNINIHALRSVCTKQNEDSVNRYFSVAVPNQKGWSIVWTCVKDNTIKENDD